MDTNNEYRIYFAGLRELVRNPQLSPQAKALLVNLLLYAGTDNKSFPSQETLAADFGYKSSRQIRNLLNELKKIGIYWERGGFGRSNRYLFSEEIYCRNDKNNGKYNTPLLGNGIPIENGITLPTKVVSEGNQLSSSHIQQLFEKTFKTKLNYNDLKRLHKLCEDNPEGWIKDAITELSVRGYPTVNVGLLAEKLADYSREGRAKPKLSFQACGENGCANGYLFASGVGYTCQCRNAYEAQEINLRETNY